MDQEVIPLRPAGSGEPAPPSLAAQIALLLAAYDDWCAARAAHARTYRRAQIGECPMAELAGAASIAAAAGRRFHSAFKHVRELSPGIDDLVDPMRVLPPADRCPPVAGSKALLEG